MGDEGPDAGARSRRIPKQRGGRELTPHMTLGDRAGDEAGARLELAPGPVRLNTQLNTIINAEMRVVIRGGGGRIDPKKPGFVV